MNDYFLEFIKEPVSRGGLRDNNPFGVPLGARPKRNLADAYRQGADVFKQKLTQGELGPMFGPAQGLLQFATGQGITVGDESGTATISPGGGFNLAGKYNEFTINPFMRQVGANFTNPDSNFSVGGSIGMGPQGFYDPRAELNFQVGGFNQQPVKQQIKTPQEKINPLTGDKIIIDEQGYTRRIPYASRQDVMPPPYRGPYAR
tara:strand:+ start:687 stop:1295 length:609 start_codon:yes stop_codon:yes gene_type:complete